MFFGFMEYATARNGACRLRVSAMHLHGQEAGPAFLGTSVANQRLYILVRVGQHHEEAEVGLVRMRTPESLAE